MMTLPYLPGRTLTRQPRLPYDDFTGRGQAVLGFRYRKYEASTDEDLGPLNPERGGTLTCDTTQAVGRSLKLTLKPGQAEEWDPIAHRIRLWMVTEDEREWQLGGRYMSVDDTEATDSAGTVRPLALADETWQVSFQIGDSFSSFALAGDASVNTGGTGLNVSRVAQRFLNRYPLFNPQTTDGASAPSTPTPLRSYRVPVLIEPTQYLTSAAWAGNTNGTQVLDNLAVAGDYMPPWIDNAGVLRMIRTFDPAEPGRVPDFDFDAPTVVDRSQTPAITTDLMDAPNRYIVVGNSGSGASASGPIVGTYDVPSTAPWSIARRGYVVPTRQTMPVESGAQASAIARTLAQRQQVYKRVTLTTVPNPLHDGHQVVRWRGQTWLQLSWTLTLAAGASMSHQLRRVYS